MKKVLVFLSILMLSFSGVLFACNEDRYADLRVVLTSITSDSGREVTYNSDGNYYEVYYGDTITVNASVSSSSDVSRDVVFTSSENFPVISSSITSNSADFRADMPSGNETFRVNVRSRETNRGELNLYFKVLLPTSEINLADNLGIMIGEGLDLTSQVEFYSDFGTGYEPDERGVSFVIDGYTNEEGVSSIVEERDGAYYIEGISTPAFDIENGLLQVLDSTLDGVVSVVAKSEKYDDDLESYLESSDLTEEEKQELRENNNRLIDTEDIEIVTPITLDDIVITGGQVGFQNYRDDVAGNRVVKLNTSLYNNVDSTYNIGSTSYSYNYEKVEVFVDSAEDIDISYIIGDMIFEGETFVSQNNVLEITSSGTNKDKFFEIRSGNAGTAYVDFVFNYGFDNDISFSFGDLYNDYLESLAESDYNSLEDYEKYTMFVFDVSLVSDLISVSQDGETILRAGDDGATIDTDEITIFDSYAVTKNQNGSKFEVNLSSRSGILSDNKIVRVYLKGQTSDVVVSNNLIVINANGAEIALNTTKIDGTTNYYFDLDLSDDFNKTFYLRAKSVNENASFSLTFENLVSHEIMTREGEIIGAIQGGIVDTNILTTKGVENIEVKAIKGVNDFVNLDNYNLSTDPSYQQLVLGVNNSNGTLIAYFFDSDVEGEIEVSGYDESIIEEVTSSESDSDLGAFFSGAYDESELQIGGVIAFKGLRVGETSILFTAENGYQATVKVKVVDIITEVDLSIEAQVNTVFDDELDNPTQPYVSMKCGYSFNIIDTYKTNASGVISKSYTSSDNTVASVSSMGRVSGVKEGQVTITTTITYYTFSAGLGNFYQWGQTEYVKTFTLQVYIPMESFSLTPNANIFYDVNSLSYDNESLANIQIGVSIIGSDATVAKDPTAVRFEVESGKINYLEGVTYENGSNVVVTSNFSAIASLPTYARDVETITLTVIVSEFGFETSRSYTITIRRAVKVENIDITASKNGTEAIVDKTNETYELRVRNGSSVDIRTFINPEEVLVDDLIVRLSSEDGDISTLAGLTYGNSNNVSEIVINGMDRFTLNVNEDVSGEFDILIIAKDSFTSEDVYDVSRVVHIIIEDGVTHAYSISNSYELKNIEAEPDKSYVLVADIILNSDWEEPIKGFNGVLNGNNHTISGLQLSYLTESGNVGLFESIDNYYDDLGVISRYGTVYDLKLNVSLINIRGDVTTEMNVGALAGINNGIVMNVAVEFSNIIVSTSSVANIGGLVGTNNGVIYNFSIDVHKNNETDDVIAQKYFGVNTDTGIFAKYDTGNVPNDVNLDDCIANIYSTGKMAITSTNTTYVGGLVGKNTRRINGYYGVYNKEIDENDTIFVTSYQNEGIDVNVEINVSGGSITSSDSSVGGIAGLSQNGLISNVAVDGQIGRFDFSNNTLYGTNDNVGGIVGFNTQSGQILNSLTSIKVRGRDNVGGAVGLFSSTTSNNAKLDGVFVESYRQAGDGDNTLIVGRNNVGGIVGNIANGTIEDSYSYGYQDKFDDMYINYGDIYVYGEGDVYAGGISGQNVGLSASIVFSTFNIVSQESVNVRGLFGAGNVSVDSVFYIGAFNALEDSQNVNELLGVSEGSQTRVEFYYILTYANEEGVKAGDINADGVKDTFVSLKYEDDDYGTEVVDGNIIFNSYVLNGDAYELREIVKRSDLLRDLPTSIDVTGTGSEALLNQDGDEYVLDFTTNLDRNVFYNYSYNDLNNEKHNVLLINYSTYNSEFDLSSLFEVSTLPEGVKNVKIIVSKIDNSNKVLTITNDGRVVINRTGEIDLNFRLKENSMVESNVHVIIVQNFDELWLSPNLNYSSSYFDSKLNNPMYVVIDRETSLNYLLVDSLTQNEIPSSNFYTVEYDVKYSPSVIDEFTEIDEVETYYNLTSTGITFFTEGYFEVTVSVVFTDNSGTRYRYTDDNWTFYLNARASAYDVAISEGEIILEGEGSEEFVVTLFATATEEIPALSMKLQTPSGDIVNLDRTIVNEETGESSYDNENSPFIISLIPQGKQGGYNYNVRVSLKDEYKDEKEVLTYVLMVYDEAGVLETEYEDVKLKISPASLNPLSLNHYAYTEQISNITGATGGEGEETIPTYFYSYSPSQADSIVPGLGGLLVIDLVPYYSNILSVSVSSSLGSQGNAVNFVQMVKVKDSLDPNKYYYVYGPSTTINPDGCTSLNLVSSMPNAEIVVQGTNGILNGEISYAFSSEQGYPNLGRLYVRTIAPSSLSEEDSFDITVNVVYQALNEEGELINVTRTAVKTLHVMTNPNVNLELSHEGEEREIIAYTGINTENATTPDWIDIFASVTDGHDYSISYSVISNGQNMGQSADYAVVEDYKDRSVLRLGPRAQVGDKIVVSLNVELDYEDYETTQSYVKEITVVDAVIESLSIEGMDDNNDVKMNISSSRPLRVKINGFGTSYALSSIAESISRYVSGSGSRVPYYWYGSIAGSGQYFTLTSIDLAPYLPFVVSQLPTSNDEASVITISGTDLGLISGENQTFSVNYDTIYLDGAITYGSVSMLLRMSYVYRDGRVLLIPNDLASTEFVEEIYFTVSVIEGEEEDLKPIYDEEDLRLIEQDDGTGNYILMNDLSIDLHKPLTANFASFDGNNKVITINSFEYEVGNADYANSTDMGLFSIIGSNSIVKNVIVALPNNKDSAMDLTHYAQINFGGIAGINKGIITNCDVITLGGATNYSYTLNFNTAKSTSVYIGGFVGQNTGIITNSRVGRESVEVLRTDNSESTIVRREYLANVAPRTIINVSGPGLVAGFVARNTGTISSSFAKNMQIEVYDDNKGTTNIRTAGFVVNNSGFINGSFVTGFEEEQFAGQNEATNPNRILGGGLYSNGPISGFVFENTNYIQDCYSNINLSGSYSTAAKTSGILEKLSGNDANIVAASGFVFNMGENATIYTSYSLSKIGIDSNTHSAFEATLDALYDIGVKVSQQGTIENCYFLKETTENDFDTSEERAIELSNSAVIDADSTDVESGLNQFASIESFNGFAFDYSIENFANYSASNSAGVWAISLGSENSGHPELISANTIALSNRIARTTLNADGSTTTRFYYVADYELGSDNNPYLISSAEQFNNVFRAYSSDNSTTVDIASKFTGNIRLINHINFSGITPLSTSVEYTSIIGETAVFDGNYLSIYNMSLTDRSAGSHAFGLFRDIYNAGVKNLTLGVTGINAGNSTSVGALAGVIVDSNISNISLVSNGTSNSVVLGNNYVGALAGIVTSSNSGDIYHVSNIKSNLSVMGSINDSNTSPAITSSFTIWAQIEPISLSGTSGRNLRLYNLGKDVFYAGGIAGVIDLGQEREEGSSAVLNAENVTNIHVGSYKQNVSSISTGNYSTSVSILSDYVGGMFGFIGDQTYLSRSEFIVDGGSAISGKQVAGGIAGVNFGMIAKSYVSYDIKTMKEEDKYLVHYALGSSYTRDENVTENLFSANVEEYAPRYIGGIAGINAGTDVSGSGSIVDSYNRVDVKNTGSIGVGGIVGASYIGEIRNVYTTAGLMANLNASEDVYIGGIIGRIFDNADEGYFSDAINGDKTLLLSNIVGLNMYTTSDFDALYAFDVAHPARIGGLYGYYQNEKSDGSTGIVRIDQGADIYIQSYILKDYTNSYIKRLGINDTFMIGPAQNDEGKFIPTYSDPDANGTADSNVTYIRLWGSEVDSTTNRYYDSYLAQYLSGSTTNRIEPQDYRIYFGGSNVAIDENIAIDAGRFEEYKILRDAYFSRINWPTTTWKFEASDLLPLHNYGYNSSVVLIYTAEQFMEELSTRNNAEMTYLVMNDIDFSGITDLSPITSTFSGRLIGNAVTYTDGTGTYTRYPILFNLNFNNTNVENSTYALFENVSGGSISNLNFVISNYDVRFSNSLVGDTRASILVGNAENMTMTNVNVYSSLTSNVSRYSSSRTYSPSMEGVTFNVSQGLSYNDSNVVEKVSNVSYLKLAEYVSDGIKISESFTFTLDLTNGSRFVESTGTGYTVEVKNEGEIRTNASTFGGLVASTGDSTATIENSGANVNISLLYSGSNSSVYVGSVVGFGKGYIRNASSQSYINLQSEFTGMTTVVRDISSLYLGLIAGYYQGQMENIYIDGGSILVGGEPQGERQDPYIYVSNSSSGASGAYVGGISGNHGRYQSVGSSTSVGSIESVYVYDLSIETYIKGRQSIAGVIAKNQAITNDIYIRQSGVTPDNSNSIVGGVSNGGILVHLNDESSNPSVGGVFGENSTATIENIYSNISIKVDATVYNRLYLGGIIAQSTSDLRLINVVSDAEKLEVVKNPIEKDGLTYYENDILYAGGILANGVSLSLEQAISTVDIIVNQESSMFVGGAVGTVEVLSVANVIILSDITLKRGTGSINSYFYIENGSYYVGGLVGQILSSFTVSGRADELVLVASTIRDYAIAQKLDARIHSVIGGDITSITYNGDMAKVYFNENISLVSNSNRTSVSGGNIGGITIISTGVDSFSAISQRELGTQFTKIFNMFTYNDGGEILRLETVLEVEDSYSSLYSTYLENDSFTSGSKLNPIEYSSGGSLTNSTYYILSDDLNLSASIYSTNYTNWVLNAEGHSISVVSNGVTLPIFDTITEGSAVVGVLVTVDGDTRVDNNFSAISRVNYGFVFSCGVSGDILNSVRTPQSVSSVVSNNYGVLNRVFSLANITSDGAAGLVLYNGQNDSYIGNIYDSYYTGSINAAGSSENSVYTGLAFRSTYGVISNSYTMADIDAPEDEGSLSKVYPVVGHEAGEAETKQNLYRTYYDYVAYLGSNEGKRIDDILNTTADNVSFISRDGIYVWTTTYSGDLSLDNISDPDIGESVTMLDILQTSWIGVSNQFELTNNYARVSQNDSLIIDTTWFNFGYLTKDMQNIFVGEDEAANTKKYFDMLYTGSGLRDINNVRGENPPRLKTATEAGGFEDMPYSIKHGGLLDMLVVENCREATPVYRYYIFTRDINLIKYQKGTYWSENWDKINAIFYGNLDGDNKDVSNMFATYGLVRAIPNTENLIINNQEAQEVVVKNITFNRGNYSKTGLIAGYVGGGTISNITVTDKGRGGASYVYNGNILQLLSKEDYKLFCKDDGENSQLEPQYEILEEVLTSINMKVLVGNSDPITESDYIPNNDIYSDRDSKKTTFAGGLVGIMNGGVITDIVINGLTVMVYNEVSESDGTKIDLSKRLNEISYTGGIVGIMNGGTITSDAIDSIVSSDVAGEIDIQKMTVATSLKASQRVQTFSYVGGIAGYIGGGQSRIKGIVMGQGSSRDISIYSMYSAGGIAGMLDGGNIEDCTYSIHNDFSEARGVRIGYLNWEAGTEDGSQMQTIVKNLSTGSDVPSYEDRGDTSETIYITEIYLGGIAGVMGSGIIRNSNFGGGEYTAAINLYPHSLGGLYTIYVGGIVGDVYSKDTLIIDNCHITGVLLLKTAQEGVVGGIIGRMRGGTITNCTAKEGSAITALIGDPVAYSYENFDKNGFDEVFAEVGDYLADMWDSGELWSDLLSPQFKELIGGWEGSGQYGGVNLDHFFEYVGYAGFEIDGYSVAGGIVGRMIYGELNGKTETGEGSSISNSANITSNYSAGGIVGEILNKGISDSTSAHITNVTSSGMIYGLGAIRVDIRGSARVVGESSFNTLKDIFSDLVGSQFGLDPTFIANIAAGLTHSNAGGIVGYAMVENTSRNIDHIVIENATSTGKVGSNLATFSGGIVGLVSNKSKGNVSIKNCTSNASLLGYLVRSFAGGIVGFLEGATIEDCQYNASLIALFETLFGDSAPSGKDIGEEVASFFTDFALSMLGVPNVIGGIVGYMNSGYIYDCKTASDSSEFFLPGVLLGVRVSGGIVGVMAGGTVQANSIIFNNNIVMSLYGIAGGIIGVISGNNARLNTFGRHLSVASIIEGVEKYLDNSGGNMSGFEEAFNTIFGGLDNEGNPLNGAGIMVNGPTGMVVGFISGGIIGFFDKAQYSEFTGAFNFGRVYSNIAMIFSASEVISNSRSIASKIEEAESDGEIDDKEFDGLFLTASENLGLFGFEFSTGVTVDGQELPLIEIGASTNLLGIFDLGLEGNLDFGLDDLDDVSFVDYFLNIVVNRYTWNNKWSVDTSGGTSTFGGLTANSNICNIGDDYFDKRFATVDNDLSTDNVDVQLEDVPAGRGSAGGIIGYKTGTMDLTLSMTFSYGFEIPTYVGALLTSSVASSGIAGGIIGMAEAGLIVTASANFMPVIGRTAGGIVGYADSNTVQVVSFNPNFKFDSIADMVDEMLNQNLLYGQVQNAGLINGEIFAGGIIGYAREATINTAEIESFLSPHEIGLYIRWNNSVAQSDTLFNTPNFTDWSILQVVNGGSVYSGKYAGGLIGYMDAGSAIYMAKVAPGLGTALSSIEGIVDSIFKGGELQIFGGYAGGVTGFMQDGHISGTVSVGKTGGNSLINRSVVRIAAARYAIKSDGNGKPIAPSLEDYIYGGYAGGIVGIMRNGEIGSTKLVGTENVFLQTTLNASVNFGLSDSGSQKAMFVGGAVGYYDKPGQIMQNYTSNIHVSVNGTISNGLYTGGIFGRVDEGSLVDFSTGKSIGSGDETYPVVDVLGLSRGLTDIDMQNINSVQTLSQSTRLGVNDEDGESTFTVRGVAGSYTGGIVGYLKNGTIRNVISGIKVVGDANSVAGGVVGFMDGGEISNVTIAKVTTKEGTSGDNAEAVILYGEQLITLDNGDYTQHTGSIGGIVGLATISEENTDPKYEEGVKIRNAVMLASMSGGNYAGGIVGNLDKGTVEYSYAVSDTEDAYYAGAIAGRIGEGGQILTSSIGVFKDTMLGMANGFDISTKLYSVNISGIDAAGSIAGISYGNIERADINPDNVTITSAEIPGEENGSGEESGSGEETEEIVTGYIGGLVGILADGTLGLVEEEDSYAIEAPSVSGRIVGGLVGLLEDGEIRSGLARNVTVTEDGFYGGGIVGQMNGGVISGGGFVENDIIGENFKVTAIGIGVDEENGDTKGIALGGLIGLFNKGSFRKSFTGLEVDGGMYGGGVIGEFNSEESFPDISNLQVSNVSSEYAGGLIGRYISGEVDNSYVPNNVTIKGNAAAGGIIGIISAEDDSTNISANILVEKLTANNDVTVNIESENYAGGLIGLVDGIELRTNLDFTSQGTISGKYVGGIVGALENNAKLGGEDEDTRLRVTLSCSVEGDYIGGIVGYLNDSSVFYVTMPQQSGTAITLVGGSNISVGGIVGASNYGNIYNCTNEFDLFNGASGDGSLVASQGGIVGTATFTNIIDCVNDADIIGFTPNVNVGGIAGEAISAVIDGATNNGNLSFYNLTNLAASNISLWAQGYINLLDIVSSGNETRFSDFNSNHKGSVGGIVGKGHITTAVEGSEDVTKELYVRGTNNGTISGYYFYGYDFSESGAVYDRSKSYIVEEGSGENDLAFTSYVSDKRGQIVGYLEGGAQTSEDETDYITIVNQGSDESESTVVGQHPTKVDGEPFGEVTINWADRNEHLLEKQVAYLKGFEVTAYHHTFSVDPESGAITENPVTTSVFYMLTRTNNPDLYDNMTFDSFIAMQALEGIKRVVRPELRLESEEGVYYESIVTSSTGGDAGEDEGFDTRPIPYYSYEFKTFYAEFSTTYQFKNFTFDALQDVGYTTGESGETRDATKKDGYITQEYQNLQILDKIYGQCDCDKTYNQPPHVPNLDEVIYQTTLDDLSAKTGRNTYSSNLDSMGTESIIESGINKSSYDYTHLLTKTGNQDAYEDSIINSSDMYLILKSKLELVILEEPIETGGQLSNIVLQI